jgi:hypothetical protein
LHRPKKQRPDKDEKPTDKAEACDKRAREQRDTRGDRTHNADLDRVAMPVMVVVVMMVPVMRVSAAAWRCHTRLAVI